MSSDGAIELSVSFAGEATRSGWYQKKPSGVSMVPDRMTADTVCVGINYHFGGPVAVAGY
jgi:hypothetical protein